MTNAQVNSIGLADQNRTRPLRVLFYLFFPGSGIGRYTHELLKHMSAYPEIETELVCLPSYHWIDEATYPVWPGLREIAHPWPWRRRARFLIAQLANPLRLCRRVRQTGADVVHLCNINHLTHAVWGPALRRTGAKVVATVHTVRRLKGLVNVRYETRQLKSFYRHANGLFVHSMAQAEDLVAYSGVEHSKIHLVPHGPYNYGRPTDNVTALRKRYGLPCDKQVALFFGDIRSDKNLDLFLRAMPPHQARLHVVVAGSGKGRDQRGMGWYRNLAEELGLRDNVVFLNRYIPDEEVPDLFMLCDWVALPYSRKFNSQSGVLNVATQYDRPVLMSTSPTLAETMAPCDVGALVEADDVAALVDGIRTMQQRVEDGHEHEFEEYRRLFSWEENVRQTLAVYRRLKP